MAFISCQNSHALCIKNVERYHFIALFINFSPTVLITTKIVTPLYPQIHSAILGIIVFLMKINKDFFLWHPRSGTFGDIYEMG